MSEHLPVGKAAKGKPPGIASGLRGCVARRPVILALAAGVIADGAGAPRPPGFGPVDGKTVPTTAGLLSVGVSHTPNAITAQRLVDVRGAVRVGHPRLCRCLMAALPRGKVKTPTCGNGTWGTHLRLAS